MPKSGPRRDDNQQLELPWATPDQDSSFRTDFLCPDDPPLTRARVLARLAAQEQRELRAALQEDCSGP